MTRIVDRFRLTPFISLLQRLGRFAQRDWHCKGDKEGKKERKEEKEGRMGGALSNPMSNFPPLTRFSIVKGVQGVVEADLSRKF